MGEPSELTWLFFRSVIDGEQLLIDGLNIWEYDWSNTRKTVTVKDPIYGESHVMQIYEITDNDKTVKFAAGEFSNLVWGIYLPG
ncbi:MAG: hypothetical protein EOP50_03785 [Sphingobacteriales bacterium]|nr:MAG: hypothetical protein EOP50_03785 [Sphingobacteriales bacterium]